MQYRVKPGDTLTHIAVEYYGHGKNHLFKAIAEANRLAPPYTIQPNGFLELPDSIHGVPRIKSSPNGSTAGGIPPSSAMTKGQQRPKAASRQAVIQVPREKLADWLRYGRISALSNKPPDHQMLPKFKSVQDFSDWLLAVEQIAWDKRVFEVDPSLYTKERYPAAGFEPIDATGKKVTRDRFQGQFTK